MVFLRWWESFEPWLSRIEKFDEDSIWRAAEEIPPAWYGGSWDELEALARRLIDSTWAKGSRW